MENISRHPAFANFIMRTDLNDNAERVTNNLPLLT